MYRLAWKWCATVNIIFLFLLLVTGIWQWQYSGRFTNNAFKRRLNDLNRDTRSYADVDLSKSMVPSVNDFKKMAVFVQKRIDDLQNPSSCESAKKIICNIPGPPNGFGSQVHYLLICFTVGFMTGRTVIHQSKYMPGWETLILPFSNNCTTTTDQKVMKVRSLFRTENIPVIKATYSTFYLHLHQSLPQYITNVIEHFHSNPTLWWAGQIGSYILRPNNHLKYLIAEKKRELGFQSVIVGLQVRRTDKYTEANYHNLTEYMKFAEKWYISYENAVRKTGVRRNIYLATDDPSVVIEAKRDFPEYIFINDINATMAANSLQTRFQYSSLTGIMLDIFLLSECDYLVCTMSSNVCRLAFELMQPRFINGSEYAYSLDSKYFINQL